MESHVKHCIINVGIGSWYEVGSKRLEKSLNYHGYTGDFLTWNTWPNDNYDKSCVYNVKAAAFEEAIKQGYTHILWADCSAYAIKDVEPIFDIINNDGYYLLTSGYNCAQTCSDKCLDYFNISRNEAELYKDASSGVMGFNINNPLANDALSWFLSAAQRGVFAGSRQHDNQSQDPRFLFHRQDQSVIGIIANIIGLKFTELNKEVSYYSPNMPDSTILALRGL